MKPYIKRPTCLSNIFSITILSCYLTITTFTKFIWINVPVIIEKFSYCIFCFERDFEIGVFKVF